MVEAWNHRIIRIISGTEALSSSVWQSIACLQKKMIFTNTKVSEEERSRVIKNFRESYKDVPQSLALLTLDHDVTLFNNLKVFGVASIKILNFDRHIDNICLFAWRQNALKILSRFIDEDSRVLI